MSAEFGSPEETGRVYAVIILCIIATISVVLVMGYVFSTQNRLYQECRDKGGVAQRGLCVSQDGRIIPVGVDK